MKRKILYFLCIKWLSFARFLSNQLAKEGLVEHSFGDNHHKVVLGFSVNETMERVIKK